jgi:hypothetical protein
MNFIKALLLRKLQEPSTWAGIVSFVCGLIGWNADADTQKAIVGVGLAIVSLGMVLLNERKGPNPQNAPLEPGAGADAAAGVQLPRAEATPSRDPVPSRPGAGVRPAVLDDGSPAHPPVRPGLNPRP